MAEVLPPSVVVTPLGYLLKLHNTVVIALPLVTNTHNNLQALLRISMRRQTSVALPILGLFPLQEFHLNMDIGTFNISK